MQIQSPESLIRAIGDSKLFPDREVAALAAELAPFGGDTQAALKHLVKTERVPVYQLRKIVHGKAAELFLGPYVVLDKLGEGGMGKVYKARDTRDGRVVALKVIRPHLLSNPVVRGRYEREVRAAMALKHPNIAAAYEAGEDAGRFYMALEFVDGIDLSRMVRTFGLLPVAEATEYLRQTALGLQHAHDRGFVHRDIKPSNVVVSGERHHPAAAGPVVAKLLDMGLIRSVGFDDGPPGTDLTRDGTVVGTPDYMAPEQAKNSSTVDHRADLYNLGGAFYFLLTGRPPFPTGSPIEKLIKHQIDPPPPLQATRPDVPDALARVVARLMAKKPAERYASAGELAEVLLPFAQFPEKASPTAIRPVVIAGDGTTTEAVAPSAPTVHPLRPPSSIEVRRPKPVAAPPPAAPAAATATPADRTPTPRDRAARPRRRAAEPAPEPDIDDLLPDTPAASPAWVLVAAFAAVAAVASAAVAWFALVR